ncbi:leucine-rich repeat-containing protein 20-like isoform X2 [Pomacea canaliculata]|uniref:leucine-rich repeat-containing protein 20-like isoform X2 n=1 Tax=Pomacea canaliculata TaxID=400727 RepID=UPI000D727BC4|nr:leucine-rich repeat-containing protein 20-like isoform X2 [Pomacea canaliculata]
MAGEGVTKVVKRCDQAKESGKLGKDLSECELVHIPDAVYMLMRDTVLDICNLSANVLRRIPAKLATKFPNLTELHLSNNQLSSLPEELRHVAGLTLLDISHNHFEALPQVIYRLEALRKLRAEDNNIKEVNVTRLKAISSLTEVNFQENPLTDEVHHQLLEIRVINILVTPRDPELDTVD